MLDLPEGQGNSKELSPLRQLRQGNAPTLPSTGQGRRLADHTVHWRGLSGSTTACLNFQGVTLTAQHRHLCSRTRTRVHLCTAFAVALLLTAESALQQGNA